jgi:hypothetical protein
MVTNSDEGNFFLSVGIKGADHLLLCRPGDVLDFVFYLSLEESLRYKYYALYVLGWFAAL